MSSYILAGDTSPLRWPVLISVFCIHLCLVRALRYKRINRLTSDLGYGERSSLSRMTVTDAQKIMLSVAELEFPLVHFYANAFSLFKTYGIPSISGLLMETGNFSTDFKASKRSADTATLIVEFVAEPLGSDRSLKAIARMNYMHRNWQQAGRITDEDMLYTLCNFALEPDRWIEKFEWRGLTQMELCAQGTFWKHIGDAMLIPYGPLRSSSAGWSDGLHWLEDARRWSAEYEATYMVSAASNKQLADTTTHMLLWYLPRCLKSHGQALTSLLMSTRLREAMMYPQPLPIFVYIFHAVVITRKLFMRYLMYPRPECLRFTMQNTPANPQTGHHHTVTYIDLPWYVKPGLRNRMGVMAWITWMAGGTLPGDNDSEYHPQGFDTQNLGPSNLKGRGHAFMQEEHSRLEILSRAGCPFSRSRR